MAAINTQPSSSIDQPSDTQAYHRTLFEQARQQFSNYFLQYARQHQNDWQWLDVEHPHLLTAALYCHEAGDHLKVVAFQETLLLYCNYQGHWVDGLLLNAWAIDAAEGLKDPTTTARLTHDRADVLQQQGDYPAAERLYKVSEQSFVHLGWAESAVKSRHMRALVIRAQGRLGEAERLNALTIVEAQQLEMGQWLAHPLYIRALLARDQGDYKQAQVAIEESLALLANSDENAMIAQCHHFRGELLYLQGFLTAAREQLQTSLNLSQHVGILGRVASTQRLLGDVARAEGDITTANDFYRAAFELSTQLGDQPQQARILICRAQLALELQQRPKAAALFQQALTIYQQTGDLRGVASTALLLAFEYGQQRKVGPAWQHLGIALQAVWQARLFHPRIWLGLWKRWGKW